MTMQMTRRTDQMQVKDVLWETEDGNKQQWKYRAAAATLYLHTNLRKYSLNSQEKALVYYTTM